MKKIYESPNIDKQIISMPDIIMSSQPEDFKSYIDEPGDWGDVTFDPDDDIDW